MIKVSRATHVEIPDLIELVHQYRHFYQQDRSEKVAEYLEQRIAHEEAIVFVANYVEELNVRAVGFSLIYPTFSTVSLSKIWLLNDLFVDPVYRRHGIADQLMETVESEAKNAGATRVFLRTAHENQTAQALYEKRGWVQDQTFRRYDLLINP